MAAEKIFDYVVVGAGASGLYAARLLSEKAKENGKPYRMCLLEKSRGVGGRLSTRRVHLDDGRVVHIELGGVNVGQSYKSRLLKGEVAQDISVPFIKRWENLQVIQGLGTDYLKQLLSESDIDEFKTQSRLIRLERCDAGWMLHLENTADDVPQPKPVMAKQVLLTAPPEQVKAILQSSGMGDDPLIGQLKNAEMACRFTWVLVTKGAALESSQHFFKNDAMLDNVLVLSHKPGIQSANGYEQIQVNMTLSWSQLHAQLDRQQVQVNFEDDVMTRIKTLIPELQDHAVISLQVHKWLYAQPKLPLAYGVLTNSKGVYCVGDWTCGYGLDDAFYSAESFVRTQGIQETAY